MEKTFSLIKETKVPRRIEIQPLLKLSAIKPGLNGYFMLNTFGEPLKTNIVTMIGKETSVEEYHKEAIKFLKNNKEAAIIDVDGIDVIKCKDLLKLLGKALYCEPVKVNAKGKIIV